MTYLITQTFILLLISGLLGLTLGWYLTRIVAAASCASLERRLHGAENDAHELRAELDAAVAARSACDTERQALAAELSALRAEHGLERAAAEGGGAAEGVPAVAFVQAEAAQAGHAPADKADADDLQQIKGIGPKIAAILNDLGVHRLEQIAAWTPEKVEQINAQLRFSGRIERERWIPQAKALIAERGAERG